MPGCCFLSDAIAAGYLLKQSRRLASCVEFISGQHLNQILILYHLGKLLSN
jgi:hypothetical protein